MGAVALSFAALVIFCYNFGQICLYMSKVELSRREFLKLAGWSWPGLLVPLNPVIEDPYDLVPSPERKNDVSVLLTGDIMVGRSVMVQGIKTGNFSYPFEKVGSILRRADVVFSNLENSVFEGCPVIDDSNNLALCASPSMLEGLSSAGIDVVTLANNHSNNYGPDKLQETVRELKRAGIEATYDRNLVVKQISGYKFGFLGFHYTGSLAPSTRDYDLVSKSKNEVDKLILGIHWGEQFQEHPTNRQKEWAREFVKRGADVIAGNHPHVVQDIEYIDGKPVYYSLGNFIFDQMWEDTKKGLAVRLIFRDGQLIKDELLPTYMS